MVVVPWEVFVRGAAHAGLPPGLKLAGLALVAKAWKSSPRDTRSIYLTHTRHRGHDSGQGVSHWPDWPCPCRVCSRCEKGARDTRPIYLTHTQHRGHESSQVNVWALAALCQVAAAQRLNELTEIRPANKINKAIIQ